MKPHIKDKLKDLKSNTKKVQLTNGRLKEVPKEIKLCTGIKYIDLLNDYQFSRNQSACDYGR